jgi:phosphatidate cytidylyltransferase
MRWPSSPAASGGSVPALAEIPRPGRWRDLGVRAASAVILLPVALLCLWQGGLAWIVLVMLAYGLMLAEWQAMAALRPPRWPLAAGLAWTLPGASALVWLRGRGMGDVLFLLCVVWASDIGAYMVGRLVGGAKLAPSISPGKTRSGAIGGLAAAVLVGLIAAWRGEGAFGLAAATAAGLGVIAQAGDLLESAVKRHFGVKDSGTLIPGHGGLLDRLDAVLTVAPVAALVVAWRGMELWR